MWPIAPPVGLGQSLCTVLVGINLVALLVTAQSFDASSGGIPTDCLTLEQNRATVYVDDMINHFNGKYNRDNRYFCGTGAPEQLKCVCSTGQDCLTIDHPYFPGRDIGECGCCAAWVYVLAVVVGVLLSVVVMMCMYGCCCRNRSWCLGHPGPITPVLPRRGVPITIPTTIRLPNNVIRGYQSRYFYNEHEAIDDSHPLVERNSSSFNLRPGALVQSPTIRSNSPLSAGEPRQRRSPGVGATSFPRGLQFSTAAAAAAPTGGPGDTSPEGGRPGSGSGSATSRRRLVSIDLGMPNSARGEQQMGASSGNISGADAGEGTPRQGPQPSQPARVTVLSSVGSGDDQNGDEPTLPNFFHEPGSGSSNV